MNQGPRQCCQPAEISAAKHKSGPRKIPAAEKSAAEFYPGFPKNGRKGAELLEVCFSLEILDNLQN
jgi:hypothetical protein